MRSQQNDVQGTSLLPNLIAFWKEECRKLISVEPCMWTSVWPLTKSCIWGWPGWLVARCNDKLYPNLTVIGNRVVSIFSDWMFVTNDVQPGLVLVCLLHERWGGIPRACIGPWCNSVEDRWLKDQSRSSMASPGWFLTWKGTAYDWATSAEAEMCGKLYGYCELWETFTFYHNLNYT